MNTDPMRIAHIVYDVSASVTMPQKTVESLVSSDAAKTPDGQSTVVLLKTIGNSSQTIEQFLHRSLTDKGIPTSDNIKARYAIGGQIAIGGMGVIHDVRDLNVRRQVAMKVMLTNLKQSQEQTLSFIQEAQITGQLEHPNIVPVHELGVASDDSIFYTMKKVEGVTLDHILADLRDGNETAPRMDLDQLLTIFNKVCDAVAFAHSKGVIHRDLKPDNIMVGEFGEVLVLDWGLAKLVASAAGTGEDTDVSQHSESKISTVATTIGSEETKTPGRIAGTPIFMAPEQSEADDSMLDHRADIYALGAILYQLLTLQFPVKAPDMGTLLALKRAGYIDPPTDHRDLPHCPSGKVPASLSAVAMKALEVAPENRYQTVQELVGDIAAYRSGFATTAEHAGALRLLRLLIQRHRSMVIASGAAVIVLMAMLMAFRIQKRELYEAQLKAAHLDLQLKFVHVQRQHRSQSTTSDMNDSATATPTGNPFLGFATVRDALSRANPNAAPLNFRPKITPAGLALNLSNNPTLNDISALQGLPLTELWLDNTNVSDLTPLANMPLTYLSARHTPIANIQPLTKAPLYFLDLAHTAVTDVHPLINNSVSYLNLHQTHIREVAPLTDCPKLTALIIPEGCTDIVTLQTLPTLEFLSHIDFAQTSEAFWQSTEDADSQ